GDFADLPAILARVGQPAADGLLLDLGVSSMQLDDPSRGFSLRTDGPLDMRMDPDADVRAGDILDALSEADLAGALRGFGGERMAGRVARAIDERRRSGRLRTTFDLRDAVHGAIGRRRTGRIDAATRAFQALRILTNREMESLDAILDRFARILRPGGRAVFISFHSGEDGRVKRALRVLAAAPVAAGSAPVPRVAILTRKPERSSPRESASNPRARSARLRAAERVAEAA
ncbi:MAG: 16S rRNA (cytosine(1402)-N(4))-methyltransferase RsmH, partial [Myxococcota bacterium]|nr:16S rRNA (cytosine(1402)-N(4))-methyltransferase RsmH [Myxococcota bacterium]